MENPTKEITEIVHKLCTSPSPDVQKETVERYFTPDATFDHPLVSVPGGPGSRERLLGVYQWYRVLSPNTKVEVNHISWDESNKLLWLDVVQTFSPRFSPLPGFPADMVVRLSMRKENNLWWIEHQQDFFQPAQLTSYALPILAPGVRLAMLAGGVVANACNRCTQFFGIWRPSSDGSSMPGQAMNKMNAKMGNGHAAKRNA